MGEDPRRLEWYKLCFDVQAALDCKPDSGVQLQDWTGTVHALYLSASALQRNLAEDGVDVSFGGVLAQQLTDVFSQRLKLMGPEAAPKDPRPLRWKRSREDVKMQIEVGPSENVQASPPRIRPRKSQDAIESSTRGGSSKRPQRPPRMVTIDQTAPLAPRPCTNCNRRQEPCFRNPDQACNACKRRKVGCSLAKASVQKPLTSDIEMGETGSSGSLAQASGTSSRNSPGEFTTLQAKLKELGNRKRLLEDQRDMLLQKFSEIREEIMGLENAGR